MLSVSILAMVWGLPFLVAATVAGTLIRLLFRRMSKRVLISAAVMSGGLVMASLSLGPLDGWPGPVLAAAVGDETQFAPEYSDWGFRSVRPGMSTDDVLARVGPPLERSAVAERPDEESWRWTRGARGNRYRVREVLFKHGKVATRHSEFYVD